MKNKLLIALFVVVMACTLAFTVSAANEVTLIDGTSADLETVFNVDSGTVNNFNTGYSKDNIKNVVFPASITTVKNLNFNNSTVIESVTFEASVSSSARRVSPSLWKESSQLSAHGVKSVCLPYFSFSFVPPHK